MGKSRTRREKARNAVAALFGVAFLVLAVYGVRSMGDPYPQLFGARVVDGRLTVKAPLCPGSEVVSVRVRDYDGRKTLWKASGPLTPEVLRGEVTLWRSADFREAGGGQQPAELPELLEVTIKVSAPGGEAAGEEHTATVTVPKEQLPAGTYHAWEGLKTAREMDAQAVGCEAGGS